MKDLMTYINEQTNNAYQHLKLVGVVYNPTIGNTSFRFIYKNGTSFKQSDKDKIAQLINEYYENTIEVDVKVKRDYVDEEVVADTLFKYIYSNYTSIQNDVSRDNIHVTLDGDVFVELQLTEPVYDYLLSQDFIGVATKYLNDNSFENFEISLKKSGEGDIYTKALDANHERMIQSLGADTNQPSKVNVTDITEVFGENLPSVAFDLNTIKSAMQKCQIAGNVRFFAEKTFTSKKPDKNGNYPVKTYYTWSLKYGQGFMHCVYFPLKQDANNEFALADDMQVIVGGDIEEYMGKLNFKVKSLSVCKIVEQTDREIIQKEVNENYLYVKPEKVESMSQFNFFDVPKEPNAFLAQNDVFVFDVETTGLDYKSNEIIEIGAVKLHNGEITESFSCFVKPTVKIPSEITRLTGITDAMVANAHSISEVIVDFYKFCYGCVIMAYNIDFDYRFINSAGVKVGYKFTNRQVDAMYLARKEVKGAKNFTLSSICKRLGVSLEGAHRAINDATATAEVVKLISDNVSPN
ncbi:MAG: 3'-5' exoribonuclease [Clostridia bacterium]|nr:3'-5' exoribonuclease [Clostridia bacterium]